MQQSSQAHSSDAVLKTTADGVPQSGAQLIDTDGDMLAAVSCALYTNAKSMAEKLGIGTLHSVECHLSSGSVIIHRVGDCGDLWSEEIPSLA